MTKVTGSRAQQPCFVDRSLNKCTGQAAEPEGRSWTVAGSKGANYTVTELNGQVTCSCPGHKFRGSCKHTLQSVG